MTSYVALLRKDSGSDYGVEFPDIPGCISAGTDLEDAGRMAVESLALHVEGMVEDGEPLPEPSTLDAIMEDPEHRNTVVLLVDAPALAAPAIRINITMPKDLIAAIDKVSTNRSRFLADAARSELRRIG